MNQCPKYPYQAKEDRPTPKSTLPNFRLPETEYAYCNIEECWKLAVNFNYYKVSAKGIVPCGICKQCEAKGLVLGKIYLKKGKVKDIIKAMRVKPTREEQIRINYQETESFLSMKSLAIC